MKSLKITLFAIVIMAIATISAQNAAAQVDSKALAQVEAKADLKLMSFNLRYYKPGADGDNGWLYRKDAIVAMIREEMPDIIGLQEPHRPQVDYLKVNFQNDYATLDAGRDAMTDIVKKPAGGEHLMIMYRKSRYALLDSGFFWLSETPEVPSHGWDAMCRRVTVWGLFRDKKTGKEFYFFNSHLYWRLHEARANSGKVHIAKVQQVAGDVPVVSVGDFTSEEQEVQIQDIRSLLGDAFHLSASAPQGCTDTDLGGGNFIGPAHNRIDFIFIYLIFF